MVRTCLKRTKDFALYSSQAPKGGSTGLDPSWDGCSPYPEPLASAPQCGPSGAGDGATPSVSSGLQQCLRTTGAEGPPAEEEGAGSQATMTQAHSFPPQTWARLGTW